MPAPAGFFVPACATIGGHTGMLKLTTIFFVLSFAMLAMIHAVSIHFYLYWKFQWLDIPIHFFGGAVVALGIFTAKDFIRAIPDRFLYVVPVMAGVVIVALLWELFEIVIGIPTTEPGFLNDMIIDLIVGVIGGFVGFLVGHSIRKL
jgi:hypothetical protein